MQRFLWVLIVLTSVEFARAETTPGYTLKDTYNAAVQRTETVPIQQALTTQSQEVYNQARGSILPTVTLAASYLRQQVPASQAANAAYNTTFGADQVSAVATATQPLFRGLREIAALRQTNDLLEAQQQATENSKLALFTNVAQGFYNVLAAEQDIRTLKAEMDVTAQRVDELRARVKIGRSRTGELLTAQSQVAIIQAQVDAARAVLELALESFTFTTGLPPTASLVDPAEDLPASLPQMEEYVAQLEQRPDLKAAHAQLRSAEEGVAIAKGAHLPSINGIADYYIIRAGFLGGINWDAGVALTWPIFQGGVIQSQVRQAAAVREQSDLQLSLTRRSDQTQIQTYYKSTASGLQQIRYLLDAVEISDKDYKVNKVDYDHGLVTNLDVLTALQSYYDSQRNLDRTRYQTKASYAALQAAVGKLPER